jgi:hypothetical protein
MRVRALPAAALAVLLAVAPAFGLPALAASVAPVSSAPVADAVAAAPKVVIVVGATHEATASYRTYADLAYAEAIKYTPNVVKVYSPNATWSKVKAAAQGATILLYLGHGSGYPKTSSAVFDPNNHDGMGLNKASDPDDYVAKYYGENYVAGEIRLAKNAVVILSHLCYASGNSESGNPEPTYPVARARLDNFASGFLRAGARTVIADTWNVAVVSYIRSIFTTDQSIGDMWKNAPSNHGHQMFFTPTRNPAYQAGMDPNSWTSGFYRSIVGAFDMRTTDVLAGAGVATTGGSPDTTAPELWSVDGPTTISPNFDGLADRLALVAQFSESATWNATIRDAGDAVLRAQSGTGHQAFIDWDAMVGGAPAPAGTYSWHLRAADTGGNPVLDQSGTFTVVAESIADTGVLVFKPAKTVTTSSTITYSVQFSGAVTGLTASDFLRQGTAANCKLGAPTGGPTSFAIAVTECSTGSVSLSLASGSVTDSLLATGPAGTIAAAKVIIDRSAPTVSSPRVALRTGLQLGTNSTKQPLPMTLTWSGSDGGSGIASYDVKRSVDGGAYSTIARSVTATSLNTTMTPGHSYRFKVRARDKAGNLGAWVGPSSWYTSLTQQSSTSVHYSGAWTGGTGAGYSGSSVRFASAAGASASYTFKGRSIGWVTTQRPDGGLAQVFVDGVLVATIDTAAPATAERYVAFAKSWSSYASHTIRIVVVGGGRVDLDAFELLG